MTSIDVSEIHRASSGESCALDEQSASAKPLSFPLVARRQFLEAAGTVLAGGAAALLEPQEASADAASIMKEYFSILATGEALFVTFYENAVANANILGLGGEALNAIQAILAEEQIHYNFAVRNGGVAATTHFSMPQGAETFEDRGTFLATQQLGEFLTNAALNAWIKDWATMGNPRLAQIGGQLQQVEGGHRVVGRVLLDAEPWDNWGFGPVKLASFLDVPTAVTQAGFLSPKPGNSFAFRPVSPNFPGVINAFP